MKGQTKKDLLQLEEKKNDNIPKMLLSILIAFILWAVINICIWKNYTGNWMNYYETTSKMVFFLIMILLAIYDSYFLNMRIPLYIILFFCSILIYLNGVNNRIPVIDIITTYIINIVSDQGGVTLVSFMKDFTGKSFYEALLTWIILDVPFQILENKKYKEWETTVKYVYHSIFCQIQFLISINYDNKKIHIQKNQIQFGKIESFCIKRIRRYSRRLSIYPKKLPLSKEYLQNKEEYEHLLKLIRIISLNPDHLDGHEYLKLLYEAEAIFKDSRIIRGC